MKGSHHQDINVKKYYILTQPSRLSDLKLDDLDDDANYAWRDKARKLQSRRWRRLKHELA